MPHESNINADHKQIQLRKTNKQKYESVGMRVYHSMESRVRHWVTWMLEHVHIRMVNHKNLLLHLALRYCIWRRFDGTDLDKTTEAVHWIS